MKKRFRILILLAAVSLYARAYNDGTSYEQAVPFATAGYTLPQQMQSVQWMSPSEQYYQERIATTNDFLNATPYTTTTQSETNGVRRARPNSWDEPGTPVGDTPWLLVALFAAGVVGYTYRKQKHKRPTE